MPCCDGYGSNEGFISSNSIKNAIKQINQDDNLKIAKLQDKINQLEASLCSLITELEKEDIGYKIISRASRLGLIDLMSFWNEHSDEDYVRLSFELHKFSEHEQYVLKDILNKI